MVRSFLQFFAAMLTLEASYFLLKSSLGMDPERIAALLKPFWNGAPHVKSLADQEAYARVGFFLLLAAFTLQVINSLWPLRWTDFEASFAGPGIALVLAVLVYRIASYWVGARSRRTMDQALKLMETDLSPTASPTPPLKTP